MLTRRSLFTLPLLAGCYLPIEDPMSKAKNSPWLMWGSSQGVQIAGISQLLGINGGFQIGQQGAAVGYGRPDAWRFFFQTKILGGNIASARTITIGYDLNIGLGRGATIIQNFVTQVFNVVPTGAGAVILPVSKWTTVSQPPPQSDVTPLVLEPPIDVFVAETIQVNTTILVSAINATDNYNFQIDTFFAPNVHIRPDWFGQQALGSGER